MNRKTIVEAVKAISLAKGYSFFSTTKEQLPAQVTAYPALCLQPLQFRKMEGRKHGKITYSITLNMLVQAAKMNPSSYEERWAQMENDMLTMLAELSSNEKVIAIEQASLKGDYATLTSSGELSLTATAEVVIFF